MADEDILTIVEHLGAGILVTVAGKPIYANAELARIFGYGHPNDILGLSSWLDIAAEHEHENFGLGPAIGTSGTAIPNEFGFQGLKADGNTIQLSNRQTSILWQGQEATLSTIIDNTESLRSDIKLRASEKRYRDLMEGSIQGVLIATVDRKPLAANKKCAEIFGYGSVEEILALDSTHALIAPHELERLDSIRKPYEDGQAIEHITYEFEGVRKDGSAISLNLYGNAVEWDGQRASHLTLMDISKRKQAETQLLEKTIEAEHANRQKSEFLAHMSHELRTPLNAIIGFSQIISEEIYGRINNSKYREYSENILESGHHLLHLINDILDLSKIEAGEFTLDEEEIDLDALLKSCLVMIRGRIEAQSISFQYEQRLDLPNIRGDKRLIRQIILNLLSNAVKFNKADGSVSLSVSSDQNGAISIAVSDTGIGIAAHDLSGVMASFMQVRSSPHISREGTGLGLSLSKQLVELHGGTLELQSELGEGTIATINFPVERTQEHRS